MGFRFRRMKVESDNVQVVSALRSKSHGCLHEVGWVVDDCKLLVRDLEPVVFHHVKREANRCADAVARYAEMIEGEQIWLDDLPVCLHRFLGSGIPV
ncbi:hypothetical protein SLE2022_191690 [Rubroshorea leprosula]